MTSVEGMKHADSLRLRDQINNRFGQIVSSESGQQTLEQALDRLNDSDTMMFRRYGTDPHLVNDGELRIKLLTVLTFALAEQLLAVSESIVRSDAVERVLTELNNRAGFDAILANVDDETMAEFEADLAAAIYGGGHYKLSNEPEFGITDIARVAHEINRAYCRAVGDDSQPSWIDAPMWQKQSAFDGVAFHLENPDAGPSASHENWLKQKIREGWEYGEVKDPERKKHPCMVAFDELPVEQKAKDHLFRAVVHALKDLV